MKIGDLVRMAIRKESTPQQKIGIVIKLQDHKSLPPFRQLCKVRWANSVSIERLTDLEIVHE